MLESTAQDVQRLCHTSYFRVYTNADVIGCELGGAVKNVLAIACGVVDGAGLGRNARAALIARGFAEMTRFGLARGARPETLAGMSGLGDLVLTCSSEQSRNFSLGMGLGRGESAADLLADRRTEAEGAFTAPVLVQAAQAAGVEMPIVEAVAALLDGHVAVAAAVESLLARPLKEEAVYGRTFAARSQAPALRCSGRVDVCSIAAMPGSGHHWTCATGF